MAPKGWQAEFWTILFLIVATRVADGAITYAITPDLSREINPVHSVFGLGWAGLIGVAAAILAPIMLLNYVSLRYPADNFPAEPGLSFSDFRARYFDPKGDSLFARAPWRVMGYVCGYVFPRAIIVWSVLVLAHNALVYVDAAWYRPVREYRLTFTLYLALPVLAFVFIWILQRKDYRRYRAQA